MRIGSRQGVDSGRPVAPQHVRQRHLRVGLRNAGRVEQHRRAPVGRLDAVALLDLVEDRLRDRVTRPERVGELLALPVQQHRAVRARRLGDRIALHVGGPGAAVRVVLERVEVARLGAEPERDLRDLAGGAGVVGGELAALLGLPVAAAAGGEDDRRSVDLVVADARPPAVLRRAPDRRAGSWQASCPAPASHASRSPVVIACPVRSPTWSRRLRDAPPHLAIR